LLLASLTFRLQVPAVGAVIALKVENGFLSMLPAKPIIPMWWSTDDPLIFV
jgi:hypothetical protein